LSAAEYKHILRIAGKDIEGSKKVIVALSKVKGIGYNFAHVLLQSLNINLNSRVGFLTDRELADIETAIKDPSRSRLPEWYWNRRKDMETGSHRHLITSDLDFMISNDIDREKTIMSWRGYRHMFGLRVRGQCTRTTGRKGGAVGVKKIGKPMPSAVSSTPSKGTGSGSATVTGEDASSIKPAAEAENANTTSKK
jgi:small subunit ribosomal protein S13